MEIDGKKVKFTESEIDESACPLDVGWAASQLRRYGPGLMAESRKLEKFLVCPEVWKKAGYLVEVITEMPGTPEAEPEATDPAESEPTTDA